jgi:ubiquitin-protein ligase
LKLFIRFLLLDREVFRPPLYSSGRVCVATWGGKAVPMVWHSVQEIIHVVKKIHSLITSSRTEQNGKPNSWWMVDSPFNNELQNQTEQKTQSVTEDNDEFYVNGSNWFKVCVCVYMCVYFFIHTF